MAFVETPLSEQVLRIWEKRYQKEGSVTESMNVNLNDPFFRMEFIKVDLAREYLELTCTDGAVIEYHQMERKSDKPDVRRYSESVKFRKGAIEDIISGDFFVRDYFSARDDSQNLFVVEQDEERPYDSAPLVHRRHTTDRRGYKRIDECLVTPYFKPKSHDVVLESISNKLDDIQKRWLGLKSAAESFGKGFAKRFASVNAQECDEVYILTSIEGELYLANLGGKRFIDAAMSSSSLEDGLKTAYMKYQPRLMDRDRVSDVAEVMGRIAKEGKLAIFTTKDFALQILGNANFDYDSFTGNRIRIGEREIRLGLKKENYSDIINRFIDCLFCEDEYASLAIWYDGNAAGFKDMIRRAEHSKAVKTKAQQTGIKKRLLATDLPLNQILSDKEGEFFDTITEEIDIFAAELKMRDEFIWWENLREQLGHILSAPLDHPHFTTRKRQDNFREKFVDIYSGAYANLQNLHYDAFIHIDQERLSFKNGSSYGHKRIGIGNIMIDFGDRSIISSLDKDHGLETQLRQLYVDNKNKMTAHLFKGKLLRPMLDRMLPAGGSTVAVDTCSDRVEELSRFCEMDDDPYTMKYQGVNLVFVNGESRTAIDDIRKSKAEVEPVSENDILADMLKAALDKAEDDKER